MAVACASIVGKVDYDLHGERFADLSDLCMDYPVDTCMYEGYYLFMNYGSLALIWC